MKFDGTNLEEVMRNHIEWVKSAGALGDEYRADFSGWDLQNADMAGASLYGANLRGANLRAANLYLADLRCADLTGANLFGANLFKANLRGAINPPFLPMDIPDTGSFIGWKRVKDHVPEKGENHYEHSIIAKLLIPEDAERVRMSDGECRASKVVVLELQTLKGEKLPDDTVGFAIKDRGRTRYVVGETVSCNQPFSFERWEHMVPGIYFYMERQRAVEYLTLGMDPNGKPYFLDSEAAIKELEKNNHW